MAKKRAFLLPVQVRIDHSLHVFRRFRASDRVHPRTPLFLVTVIVFLQPLLQLLPGAKQMRFHRVDRQIKA
jgi:hypothetical protein